MRWQRAARYAMALAGLGVAGTLYVSTRPRPASERPVANTVADPQVTMQGDRGQTVRFQGSDREFIFKYARVRELTDGRTLADGVEMKLEDGTVVTAETAETRGRLAAEDLPAELLLKGKVHMVTTEGAIVDSEQATYQHSEGRLTMTGPVSFVRGRTSGRGVGGSYERDTGVFMLQSEAQVAGAAVDAEPPFTAAASRLTFNRASKSLLFDGSATIDTASSKMTASRATLYLTDDKEHFRVIELRDQSRVAPIGDPAAPGAAPDMRAADIDLSFHEGTQALERAVLTRDASMVVIEGGGRQSIAASTIIAVTAPDGRTLTELDARERVEVRTPSRDGGPERQVTAATLFAKGEPRRGLTSASFSGGVTFVETTPGARGRAATERRGTSQALTLVLGGRLDAIDEARFQRDVVFRDGDVTGDADLLTYRAAKGQVTLDPASPVQKPPHVTSGDIDVHAAERIDLDLTTRDVHAVGDVRTVMRQAAGAKGGPNAMFDGTEPTTGFGREFWYTGKTGQARYVGRTDALASIRQGDRRISARSVEIDRNGGNLTASGAVDSTLLLDGQTKGQGGAPPAQYRISGETLEYHEERRVATYTGLPKAPVVLNAADGTTTSQRLVLTLARQSRTLDRLDATGNVHLKLANNREALADTLTYEAAAERHVLRGKVVLRVEDEKPGSCTRWQAPEAHFTSGTKTASFPPATGAGFVHSEQVNCAGALTR